MNNFKRIFALLAVAISIPLFSFAQTMDTDILIAQIQDLQAQQTFTSQQSALISQLLQQFRSLSAQLQACKNSGIPENGLGFFIKLDNPNNLQSIISGYQPVLIKWHSGYETIKYDSGAKVGLLEIIKVDTENPKKGNKNWGTKIQRVVGLNGYYNWYPVQSGRYVISIIPCKTVINNVCSLGDSAVGQRVEVMVNKAGCSDFWTQAKVCPQPANSGTNNAADTVKYSVDAQGCAVATCLAEQGNKPQITALGAVIRKKSGDNYTMDRGEAQFNFKITNPANSNVIWYFPAQSSWERTNKMMLIISSPGGKDATPVFQTKSADGVDLYAPNFYAIKPGETKNLIVITEIVPKTSGYYSAEMPTIYLQKEENNINADDFFISIPNFKTGRVYLTYQPAKSRANFTLISSTVTKTILNDSEQADAKIIFDITAKGGDLSFAADADHVKSSGDGIDAIWLYNNEIDRFNERDDSYNVQISGDCPILNNRFNIKNGAKCRITVMSHLKPKTGEDGNYKFIIRRIDDGVSLGYQLNRGIYIFDENPMKLATPAIYLRTEVNQQTAEPVQTTCSTVYKPRLMSSVASLSASKLGEGKATFRFTLVAPKERSIDISAFGMSGYDNSAPGTNPLPMEIVSVSASVPKQGDIYTIPAGRLAVFTVTGILKPEKRQYYYAVLDRVDWNCQGVTLETGNLFLGGGKEPKTNAAFIAVQTNINSPKLSFVSFPGDKDRNLIVPGENTAGYYPLIGHIGFKALEKDAVINNIRGKIFAFDKNGIPKPVSAVLRKVYLSYEGVTLGEFVIVGDRSTADFSFDNLSFKISKAGTPNIALGQEVLEFLAIASQDVKNGDYIIWQADQAQGTNDSGENIATDNILKGKKIYFSHAYTDFVLASANITKIFEKYGESDVAEATFIFKVSPMGKDAYIKSSDLRLSSNLPADITTSISADNLAELNTVTDQYLIHDGSTATFMIKGLIKPQTTGYYYLALLPINWSDGADSFTFSLVNDFRTPSMWLKYYSPNNNCSNGICESAKKRVIYYNTASMFDNYNEILKRIQALIKP